MKKSWGMLDKILSGVKVIESRWYTSRRAPWDRIFPNEEIFFKNSGEPVTVKCKVKQVLQYANLTQTEVTKILKQYGKDDGIADSELTEYYELFKNKKYCLLIFLKKVEIIKPFNISKKGFGLQSAWLTVGNIDQLKIK